MSRVSIHIVSKNRPAELYGLLCSVVGQLWQEEPEFDTRMFDFVIVDDSSDIPYESYHYLSGVMNRLRLFHCGVQFIRTPFSNGVCAARNFAIDNDIFKNDFVLRLDDDIILPNRFMQFIANSSYDQKCAYTFATPSAGFDHYKRTLSQWESRKMWSVIQVDKEGNVKNIGDDCWVPAYESQIQTFAVAHFRSSILYPAYLIPEFRYPMNLTNVGFREEAYLSIALRKAGIELRFVPGIVYYHNQSPQGGCRDLEYARKVQIDEQTFREFIKLTFKTNPELFEVIE